AGRGVEEDDGGEEAMRPARHAEERADGVLLGAGLADDLAREVDGLVRADDERVGEALCDRLGLLPREVGDERVGRQRLERGLGGVLVEVGRYRLEREPEAREELAAVLRRRREDELPTHGPWGAA